MLKVQTIYMTLGFIFRYRDIFTRSYYLRSNVSDCRERLSITSSDTLSQSHRFRHMWQHFKRIFFHLTFFFLKFVNFVADKCLYRTKILANKWQQKGVNNKEPRYADYNFCDGVWHKLIGLIKRAGNMRRNWTGIGS